MTITTSESMITAAEVWEFSSQEPVRRSFYAETDPHDAQLALERIQADLSPVVLDQGESDSASNGSPGNAMLAVPFMIEGVLRAGLVLSINCPPASMGAVEIWKRDQRDELGLNGAVFSSLSRFASISRHVRFPRGSGLPGQCWENRRAVIVTGLGSAPNFMRAAGARAGGLDVGAALPVMTSEFELNSVILLLSSKTTPIAQVFEIWDVDEEQQCLRNRHTTDSRYAETMEKTDEMVYLRGEGIVGKVWDEGVPLASDNVASIETKRRNSFLASGLSTSIAWPIYVGETIKSVFVMLN